MENITISQITAGDARYQDVWELRETILRKPLGMSLKNEDLSADAKDVILAAMENNAVIGCLMLADIEGKKLKLRQMAVYENWQGKGVGRKLVRAAEQYAATKGYEKIVLHARKVALGFYENLEYTITSGEFAEVGIPHFVMEKAL
jgi:predicted GNAT family N-acyltransferase